MSIYLKACVAVLLTISSINLRANPGDLYVSDNDGIYRFAPDGTRTTVALLSRPRGLTFDKSGILYGSTLDTAFHDNQGRILKFAPDGSFTVLATANGPEGIAFHKMNGNLFVTATPPVGTFDAATILKISPPGNVKTLGTISDAAEFSHLQFSVTFDNDQTLFAADLFANTIYMVTASGKVAPYVTIGGPEGLAFDRDGNLYVGGSGPPAGSGNITKIAPDGTQTTFASGFSEVRGLAFDSGGNLFVADKGAGVIYKITPNGTVSPFMSGFNMLQFLAFEP